LKRLSIDDAMRLKKRLKPTPMQAAAKKATNEE